MKVDPDLNYDLKLAREIKNKSKDFEDFITYFFPVTFHAYREGANLSILERLKSSESEVAIEILKANLSLKNKNSHIAKAADFFGLI